MKLRLLLPNKLIIGLGNPGEKFAKTRHNIGFIAVSELAERLGLKLKREKKIHGQVARGEGVTLLLPTTYMNESGRAVKHCLDYYQMLPSDLLVVCDDAELDFLQLRLRGRGSSGGHNGLGSIEQALGTREYPRLRIGVGRGEARELEDHVLGKFSAEEWEKIEERKSRLADVMELMLKEPLETVMNKVNRRGA